MGEDEKFISIHVELEVTTGLRVVQWAVEIGSRTQERSELIAWRRQLNPPESVRSLSQRAEGGELRAA